MNGTPPSCGYEAQLYDSSHTAVGAAFALTAPQGASEVRVAALTDGGFAITWVTSNLQPDSGGDIVAQEFEVDANGNITAGAVQVVSDAAGNQSAPSIAATGDGFTVVYTESIVNGGFFPAVPRGGSRRRHPGRQQRRRFLPVAERRRLADPCRAADLRRPWRRQRGAPLTLGGAPAQVLRLLAGQRHREQRQHHGGLSARWHRDQRLRRRKRGRERRLLGTQQRHHAVQWRKRGARWRRRDALQQCGRSDRLRPVRLRPRRRRRDARRPRHRQLERARLHRRQPLSQHRRRRRRQPDPRRGAGSDHHQRRDLHLFVAEEPARRRARRRQRLRRRLEPEFRQRAAEHDRPHDGGLRLERQPAHPRLRGGRQHRNRREPGRLLPAGRLHGRDARRRHGRGELHRPGRHLRAALRHPGHGRHRRGRRQQRRRTGHRRHAERRHGQRQARRRRRQRHAERQWRPRHAPRRLGQRHTRAAGPTTT